jgi:hypothetical protein
MSVSDHMRFLISVPTLLLIAATSVFPQKVTTKVSVYNEIFLTDTGFIALPENAVELEPRLTIRSGLFTSPLRLALDADGNVYVTSSGADGLCRYGSDGKLLGLPGNARDARIHLKGPEEVAVVADQVLVYERLGKRLTFMNLGGVKRESWKIPDLEEFAVDREGRLYVAPLVETKESPLVRSYSSAGKFREFGKALAFPHSLTSLNSRSIAVDDDGDIFVAFRYLPIVRKYSREGALLAEFRISSPVMEAKAKYNLKAIGEGITDVAQRAGFKPLIIEIKSLGNSLYLVSHNPRLEITELDAKGLARATYWMDSREIYFASDLAIREVGGEKRFYVAHSSPPEYSVDVLQTKPQVPVGLDADIQKWTEEIGLFPENPLAYMNRGMARHLQGDYSGAIADFTTAIKLAPASSVAHNDRGLSKVKTRDFSGAVDDFSKAIELDPRVAAIYFNRGIARIHTHELELAIGDFESAAKLDKAFETKAKEQIDYCRSHLGKRLF